VYYSQHPLPPTPPDDVFLYFISTALPTGIKGLLVAAILSAGMSTLSTSINSSATLSLADFYSQEDEKSLSFLRIASVVMAVFSTGAAMLFLGVKSALDV
jgi:SSS family solute:Na+ symporter